MSRARHGLAITTRMFIWTFLAAMVLTYGGLLLSQRTYGRFNPRPEGIVLVGAALIVGVASFWLHELARNVDPTIYANLSPDQITALPNPMRSPEMLAGLQLWVLTLAVYVLAALRGLGRLPAWVADIIVIGAAFLATRATSDVIVQVAYSSSADSGAVELGPIDTLITVAWIWLVARLCASLNRVPAVAGGYLGLFALTIALLLSTDARTENLFAPSATWAVAGAGLAAFVIALKRPTINLGWSSVLAMGFLVGVSTALGLLKNTLPALLALGLLALGLPLLNVSIVRVRARLRGYNVEWSNRQMRLDQALEARGVPRAKIALYYFCVGAWLCSLAFLATHWFFGTPPSPLLAIFYALVLLFLAGAGAIVFFSLARLQMRRQADEQLPESIEAFGVKLSPVSMNEALDRVEGFIASRQPHQVLTTDANAILTSRNDPEYLKIMRGASMTTPDGFGVIWGARLLNLPIYERVTGVDMVTGICERACEKGYKIYILGSGKGVAATAARNLEEKYPGLEVVGTYHGFWRKEGEENGFSVEESDEMMADVIAEAAPDVLFVAMGIPMQEKFIAAQLQRMKVPVSMGVGGSFDVYSGKFTRAPVAVQRIGLEWLYRVWVEPARWNRMGYVPKFMLVALKTWMFGGPREEKSHEAF